MVKTELKGQAGIERNSVTRCYMETSILSASETLQMPRTPSRRVLNVYIYIFIHEYSAFFFYKSFEKMSLTDIKIIAFGEYKSSVSAVQ